jgi:hypothetical protein
MSPRFARGWKKADMNLSLPVKHELLRAGKKY